MNIMEKCKRSLLLLHCRNGIKLKNFKDKWRHFFNMLQASPDDFFSSFEIMFNSSHKKGLN